MKSKNSLKCGDKVTSDYRVEPFYLDEILTVLTIAGSRTLVSGHNNVQGWLDTSSLTRVEFSPKSKSKSEKVSRSESYRELGMKRTPYGWE